MILFINACVRKESRTLRLAQYLIDQIRGEDRVEEIRLEDFDFPKVDEEFILKRDELAMAGEFSNPMLEHAVRFAKADKIVIAAPFWDLSFPASLKQYMEQVTANGVTFSYSEEGIPQGKCRASRLYYVTTAGGRIFDPAFGFGYVEALARDYYGIPETCMVKAEDLDILGADPERILQGAMEEIKAMTAAD